jgi:predicted phage tail protein
MSSSGRVASGPLISGSGGQRSRPQQSQPVQQQYVVAAQPEQYVPTEATNSLFSTSYIKILDAIGEGEIQGPVKGLQSIYLDGTPIQNPDGSLNFRGVSVEIRNGTQFQGYIPGYDEIASETGVGVVVTDLEPVTRTITEPVDAARVIVTLPTLQEFTNKGDVLGSSVYLQIYVQNNGGGYYLVLEDIITGRTSQQYQRQYRINLSGPFPVDIQVNRVTPDSTSSKVNNAFSWSSFSEIIYAKLAYPNTAVIGYRIEADQFNGAIPSRSCRLRGLKVQIPSNATVDNATGRLIYSGVWNGTFGAAQWTSDPAWCLWALLTSRRFGFGDHLDASKLDRWAFYSASQYASALVPDGFGGWEPRFSCNANIQTADDAYRLISDLCSVMRCMPYWAAGALTISQDRPADPSFSFTLANVGPEAFNYSGSSLKTRPTVAVVRYQDLDLRSENFEVVEDAAGIIRYGVAMVEVEAFACTSQGQARRLGKWLLYSEANEGEVVAFTSSLAAGAVVRPGQIIQIADPLRAGSRRGGAIAAATTTSVTLDDAAGLTMANGPTLSVILANATVETRPVASITGNVVAVSPAFSSAPQANSIWIWESSNILAALWRVLSVGESDGVRYPITALAHNPSKYGFVEQGLALTKRDVTDLDIVPDSPQNLTGAEVLYDAGGRAAAPPPARHARSAARPGCLTQ